MAETYRVTSRVRWVNRMLGWLIRLGLAPKNNYLLTVRGRKTGRPYTTPVTLIEQDGRRWLVAPYGEVNWVRNARAAGRVELSRKAQSETVSVHELSPAEGAPVLKKYLEQVPIVQPYFDAHPDSQLEIFEAEAPKHPVFQIKT